MRYEGIVYRPPSEAYSLIVQVTIGCSQNTCAFCSMYKDKKFRVRDVKDVIEDFAIARATYSSVSKIFLADGDALICNMDDLKIILEYIQEHFPECKQVTCYGSPKSILTKTQEELNTLKMLGLSMVYTGLESGNAKVLKDMEKTASPEDMIQGADKIHKAGIRLSVTAISGLGGRDMWQEHAIDTGKVLSKMKPEYIGLLTLMVEPEVLLEQRIKEGRFQVLNPYDILVETKLMLLHMDCQGSIFRSNHASNYVNLSGTLNRDKNKMIEELDQAIQGNIHLKSEWMRAL
ncbi:MAG: radical SAM protein [Anaerostipes sp.]|jgi:radical SAM superfamily enzyme YgiQ (UPF0313 family)